MRLSSILLASLTAACASSQPAPPARTTTPARARPEPPSAARARTQAPHATAAKPAERESVQFVDDDVPAALARAKTEDKVLFVDAWAAWCHTCLSMKTTVLNQPSLTAYGERVVFAAIDTDREANAPFLERHDVQAWPTFFVLDPQSERVLGYWPGSASLSELRAFLDDALEAFDALRAKTPPADPTKSELLRAKAAQASGDNQLASDIYAKLVNQAPADWARRNDALMGLVESLFHSGKAKPCVSAGLNHLREVTGAARPTDYSVLVWECTKGLPKREQSEPRRVLLERLRELATHPSPEASADDRADAWAQLGSALAETGDRDGARHAEEQRLLILEEAASGATSPEARAAYDAGRASAYVNLGRPDDALGLLQTRERELPDSYEPPARLAAIYFELGRLEEARSAVERALARAYGPRKLRYLALQSRILSKLGDKRGAVRALEEELAAQRALKRGPNDPRLRDTEQRLRKARAKLKTR